jgi:hypothetical protein
MDSDQAEALIAITLLMLGLFLGTFKPVVVKVEGRG